MNKTDSGGNGPLFILRHDIANQILIRHIIGIVQPLHKYFFLCHCVIHSRKYMAGHESKILCLDAAVPKYVHKRHNTSFHINRNLRHKGIIINRMTYLFHAQRPSTNIPNTSKKKGDPIKL